MIVYIYPKCSTCQEALRFLEKRNEAITIKDIVKEPPSPAELQQMLDFQNGKLTKLLNTSGQLYREMQLSQKLTGLTIPEIFALLSQHGMLIKRPFLLAEDFGLTGFKEAEWSRSNFRGSRTIGQSCL